MEKNVFLPGSVNRATNTPPCKQALSLKILYFILKIHLNVAFSSVLFDCWTNQDRQTLGMFIPPDVKVKWTHRSWVYSYTFYAVQGSRRVGEEEPGSDGWTCPIRLCSPAHRMG